ncbi:uncharacterized protein [Oscarella lobularis]|uniref:uncharacterized protein isoform X2 n=1 Tax=Oscarella lobularis TaxID=121494 RepID=UPI0033135875
MTTPNALNHTGFYSCGVSFSFSCVTMGSPFCNGSCSCVCSISSPTGNLSFAECNADVRRFLPYLLIVCGSLSMLWNAASLLQFVISSIERKTIESDSTFASTAFTELVNSVVNVVLGAMLLNQCIRQTSGDNDISPYSVVSALAGFRLITLGFYSLVLLNRFYSAKLQLLEKFSLSIPVFPLQNVAARARLLKALFHIAAHGLGAVFFPTSKTYSCLYIINKWRRYVVCIVSWVLIGPGVLMLLYVMKAHTKISYQGRVLNEERKDWTSFDCPPKSVGETNTNWFAKDWRLTRVFVTKIIVLYATWMPFLVVLTIYGDLEICKHETLVLIGLIIVIFGSFVQPFVSITSSRYRRMCRECSCLDPLKNWFIYTKAPSERTLRERQKKSRNSKSQYGSLTGKKTENIAERCTVNDRNESSQYLFQPIESGAIVTTVSNIGSTKENFATAKLSSSTAGPCVASASLLRADEQPHDFNSE